MVFHTQNFQFSIDSIPSFSEALVYFFWKTGSKNRSILKKLQNRQIFWFYLYVKARLRDYKNKVPTKNLFVYVNFEENQRKLFNSIPEIRFCDFGCQVKKSSIKHAKV